MNRISSLPDVIPFPPASEQVRISRWKAGAIETGTDRVAVEVPVALSYNGVSHTVMLASPTDLDDFALGFSLTEGIIATPREMRDIEIQRAEKGVVVQMSIASERFETLKDRRRSMAGRTGCGLCGTDSLDQVVRPLPPVSATTRFTPEAIQRAAGEMGGWQVLQRETGATHAAAWFDSAGQIQCLREDVGRHNALDKLIGALARARTDFAGGAFLVTSRASYEMVQKSVAAGVGLLAAVSAPTAFAIERAEAWDLTLVGFVRPGSSVAYSRDWRLSQEEER
ncbi:MAG TPA: formate dehydrogenase accessory sulfurtransferase FdhD [Magnetospirillaceae bacterium]|nr:formate dehydrogenase accessory sulfurtransferase FdhD [Magnetospirillaceae bacterium]